MPHPKSTLVQTSRTRLDRLPARASYDRTAANEILDEALIAHVGFALESRPFVLPMAVARWGNNILLHGSVASRLTKTLAGGTEVCVTVTHLDGLVLARSAFHHSMNYRSLMAFGIASAITDPAGKIDALYRLIDHLVPERAKDARMPNKKELAATQVLTLPLNEASIKIRSGPPTDSEKDLDMSIWSGVIPLCLQALEPISDPTLLPGTALPEYVATYQRPRSAKRNGA